MLDISLPFHPALLYRVAVAPTSQQMPIIIIYENRTQSTK